MRPSRPMPPAVRTFLLFAALALLSLATRWPFWGLDTLDWDEATFALAAQDVLRGHLPYIQSFDVKPPMIFLTLAGAFAAFGDSLLTMRSAAGGWVLAGSVLIALGLLPRGRGSAFTGGALYVLACSAPFGQHAGTELLANVFVSGALCASMRWPGGIARAGVIGLCLSLAVLTRNNLVVLPAAYGTWLAVAAFRGKAAPLAAFTLAGLLPVAALFAVYAAYDGVTVLWLALVEVPLRYAGGGTGPFAAAFEQVLHLIGWSARRPLGVLPLVVLAAIAGYRTARGRAPGGGLALWTLGATAFSILISGGAYTHYLLQLVPPAAMLAAIGLPDGGQRRAPMAIGAAGTALAASHLVIASVSLRPETPLRDFAATIEAEGAAADQVFAATGHLVLFHLDRPAITPVLHPSNMSRASVAESLAAAGYAGDPLARSIAAVPEWVVAPADTTPTYMDEDQAARFAAFMTGYERRAVIGDYALYRLRPPAPQAPATLPDRPARGL